MFGLFTFGSSGSEFVDSAPLASVVFDVLSESVGVEIFSFAWHPAMFTVSMASIQKRASTLTAFFITFPPKSGSPLNIKQTERGPKMNH